MTAPVQHRGLETTAELRVEPASVDELRRVVRMPLAVPAPPGRAVASPIHPFVLAWVGFDRAVATLTGAAQPVVLHLSQEIRQTRPLEPGETMRLDLEVLGARRDPRGVRFAFWSGLSCGGTRVAELVTGLLALDVTEPSTSGELPRPRIGPRGEWTDSFEVTIPPALPAAYAEVTADRNPIHLDTGAALAAGLDGVVAHGMGIVALAAELAIDRFAGGDAARIRGLGVRFSSPVRPGLPVTVAFADSGGRPATIPFQVRVGDVLALKNGWIDVDV